MTLIKTADLFSIATSGVNASSRLLQTTSNNIANVNTEGFVRERTSFNAQLVGGVDQGSTERLINQFAQNQLRRDTTSVGEWQTYEEKVNAIDNILGSDANSIADALGEFFASIQTAADDPSGLASRNVVLSEARQLQTSMATLADFLDQKEQEVNLEFTSTVERANTLIQGIASLNESIALLSGASVSEEPGALLNQRDNAVNELASLLDIRVIENSNLNGTVSVRLKSGEALVLENGTFNVLELGSDADLTFKELSLSTDFTSKGNTVLNLVETDLGGSIGGLFRYRDEVLGATQRDIGQLAVVVADAVNAQNRLGMDLDQQLGGDIFTLPTFKALPYQGTLGTLNVNGRFTPGEAENITDADLRITVTAVNAANVPTQIDVEFLDGNGQPKLDASGNPVVQLGVAIGAGFTEINGGIEVEFDTPPGFSVGNEFLLQPTKDAAINLSMATSRGDDLAFALPIRITPDANNFGDLTVTSTVVTNTVVGTGNDRSAFTSPLAPDAIDNAASSPAGVGAPARIEFNSPTQFTVRDNANVIITVVTGVTDYQNLLAQAEASGAAPPWPAAFSALDDYPGYDFSVAGTPQAGDAFDIDFNLDGLGDNRNALALSSLQDQSLVQLSSEPTNMRRTFFDAFSTIVGRTGEQSSNADITLQAAEAMKNDSEQLFQSVSGVNLDEEAANLIRFQQSYSAAAQILRTAQELFDTILAAAR